MILFLAVLFFCLYRVRQPVCLNRRHGTERSNSLPANPDLKLGIPIKEKLRVSIGAPEIADCLVLPTNKKPKEIYIKGIAAGTTNLILWQEDELMAIYDVEVSYDVSRLKEKLYQVLPDEPGIQVFPPTTPSRCWARCPTTPTCPGQWSWQNPMPRKAR